MVRGVSYDRNGIKKGPWNSDEDAMLRAYVQNYGPKNWSRVQMRSGLPRCGKSCRLRWVNYLRPDIRRGNFTPEEEDVIIRLHARLGNMWAKIALELPGRSDHEIKNHWHAHLKKKKQKRICMATNSNNNQRGYDDPEMNSSSSNSSSSSSSSCVTTPHYNELPTLNYSFEDEDELLVYSLIRALTMTPSPMRMSI